MRRSFKKLLSILGAAVLLSSAAMIVVAEPAAAEMQPSFRVTCFPRGMAQNDPIVFAGQAGKSHMHSFYGAKGVDQNTTVDSLLAQQSSQCGSNFDTVDLSAYWIPTLYKDGQAMHVESGSYQLQAYYQRAGGASGKPVDQAFPRGLKMIAGDMRATTPQNNVTYVCAKTNDTGQQRGGGHEFMSCAGDESIVAKLVFPDCWDGRKLDTADHKSHMAYSGGGECPSSHPVKLPQLTFEAWYYGLNGPASSLSWASGGAYTFHGDVISAWDTRAFANLVNQCINVAFDCNPLMYGNVPQGTVTSAQINAQLVSAPGGSTTPPASGGGTSEGSGTDGGGTSAGNSDHSGHGGTGTPTPTPSVEPSPSPSISSTASPRPSTTPRPGHNHGNGESTASTESPKHSGSWFVGLASSIGAILTAIGVLPFLLRRRYRRRFTKADGGGFRRR